jgi:beta-galactosidase
MLLTSDRACEYIRVGTSVASTNNIRAIRNQYMHEISRRRFLISTAEVTAAAALPVAPAWLRSFAQDGSLRTARRLVDGWEYFQGSLDGAWQVWNSSEIAVWAPVSLPHCFNHYDACDPDTPAYRGPGWYRMHLVVENPYPNGRTLLHFGGAGQTTDIYLGEHHLAHHVGGYDQFIVDLSDVVTEQSTASNASSLPSPGTNGMRLAIRCDNSRDLDRMPSDVSDFTLYGGLYRHVSLVYLPASSIEAIHVHATSGEGGKSAVVAVSGRLYGALVPSEDPAMVIEILDPHGVIVAHESMQWSKAAILKTGFNGERSLGNFTLSRPNLWSPSTPQLYQCRVTLSGVNGKHVLMERFGIRSINFLEDGPFFLNGERLLLRGTHRHEDHAGYAAAIPDEVVRQEMRLIKDMGANFIRLAHYQQSQLVLDLCDELGLLVWEEVPWCRAGVGGDRWQEIGRQKLHDMIDQHFNHPSVIFWGLGNEDDWPGEYPVLDKEAIRGYMKQLNDLAHQLDPSRYTSYRRCDFARDIPDVYSPSIWAGWYSGLYTEYQRSLEAQRKRVKRFIHIEWGADSHARRHSEDPDRVLLEVASGKGTDERGLAYLGTGGEARVSRDGDWSETYACNLFDWHLKTQEALMWFSGSAQWIFKDFTTPLRAENPVPRVNQKGLVERDMTRKEAYYVFQSYWSDVPMIHLYGHTWPIRWGKKGEQKMVKVYSNCAEAELFLNGVSVGVRHRDSQDFPCAGLRWALEFREGRNGLRVVGKTRDGKTVADEIDFLYQTEIWARPARFVLKEISRREGTVTCRATLHDERGVLCLDARNQVRFTLAGIGRLIDNQGTSTGSRVVQLYNGRADISVHGIRGSVSIAVSAEALPTTICSVEGTA